MLYYFMVLMGAEEGHAIEFASMLNYKTNADLEKIKIFQHPNIHLITPIIKDKIINKKSDALSAMSEKLWKNIL